MSKHHEDDTPDHDADDPEAKDAVPDRPVVAEAGEGPIPPVAGEPRPPIGN